MSALEPPLHCVNPQCPRPRNAVGREVCAECQTPLVYRHVRAVGPVATPMPVGALVAGRYYVCGPGIWLDTEPHTFPWVPTTLPPAALPYNRLYGRSWSIPKIYGFCPLGETSTATDVMLLEDAAIAADGQPLPALTEAWGTVPPLRQIHWMVQVFDLWPLLAEVGARRSLLALNNLRVQGWRLALAELKSDADGADEAALLRQWGDLWLAWCTGATAATSDGEPTIAARLRPIFEQIHRGELPWGTARSRVEQILIREQGRYRVSFQTAGISEVGRERSQNEDACYPQTERTLAAPSGLGSPDTAIADGLAILCDGIGGHEKGEVASQLAIRSLQLQAQAFRNGVRSGLDTNGGGINGGSNGITNGDYVDPATAIAQIEAIFRVANNLIAGQNDSQLRESRQRMATTATLALPLIQRLVPPRVDSPSDVCDLFIAHVGNSRAYWLTADGCRCLTTDDNLAARETRDGHGPYREAIARGQGDALTQALGTREGEVLRPTVQRLIPDETGLLLLCSDGFSDFDWVDESWQRHGRPILAGRMPLAAALRAWVAEAIQRHGHDNTTVTATLVQVVPETGAIPDPWATAPEPVSTLAPATWDSQFSEASKALLYGETERPPTPAPDPERRSLPSSAIMATVAIVMMLLGAVVGLTLVRGDRPVPPETPPETPTEPTYPAP
jgi:protein phosphatase